MVTSVTPAPEPKLNLKVGSLHTGRGFNSSKKWTFYVSSDGEDDLRACPGFFLPMEEGAIWLDSRRLFKYSVNLYL